MNDTPKTLMTQEGFNSLKKQLDELNAKRPSLVDRLSNARSMGDLSENNDYHNAKEALDFLDGQIDELTEVLRSAQVIKSIGKSQVGVGAKVKVSVNDKEAIFHIVGEWEADPKQKKISHESPLGRALVGKKVGDKVEVEVPAGKLQYTILEVN